MEKNCVSLETAKKLKAAGFPQETFFGWYIDKVGDREPKVEVLYNTKLTGRLGGVFTNECAAPTAQEIADTLQKVIDESSRKQGNGPVFALEVAWRFHLNEWVASYRSRGYDEFKDDYISSGVNLAEALAALWLKLKVTPEEMRQ